MSHTRASRLLRPLALSSGALLVSACAAPLQPAPDQLAEDAGLDLRTEVTIGQRTIDQDGIDSIEDQSTYGATIVAGDDSHFLRWEFGGRYSEEDGVEDSFAGLTNATLELEKYEAFVGLRGEFPVTESLRVYVSGGGQYTFDKLGVTDGTAVLDTEDKSIDPYVKAGAFWIFEDALPGFSVFSLGLEGYAVFGGDLADTQGVALTLGLGAF